MLDPDSSQGPLFGDQGPLTLLPEEAWPGAGITLQPPAASSSIKRDIRTPLSAPSPTPQQQQQLADSDDESTSSEDQGCSDHSRSNDGDSDGDGCVASEEGDVTDSDDDDSSLEEIGLDGEAVGGIGAAADAWARIDPKCEQIGCQTVHVLLCQL